MENAVKETIIEALKSFQSNPILLTPEKVADHLIKCGMCIVPPGSIVLSKEEIDALSRYQNRLNKLKETNSSHG